MAEARRILKSRRVRAIFSRMSAAHDPKYLLSVIGQQNLAIEKLLAERDELRALLEANGQKLDALTCLQRVYNNPKAGETNRIKAAAAIGFERPKMSVSVRIGPAVLGERLDSARTIDVTPEDKSALPTA
jgi:hypothetical protein